MGGRFDNGRPGNLSRRMGSLRPALGKGVEVHEPLTSAMRRSNSLRDAISRTDEQSSRSGAILSKRAAEAALVDAKRHVGFWMPYQLTRRNPLP
jgi:hypothetical protein